MKRKGNFAQGLLNLILLGILVVALVLILSVSMKGGITPRYPPPLDNNTPTLEITNNQNYPPPVIGTSFVILPEVTAIFANTPGGIEALPTLTPWPTCTPYPLSTVNPEQSTTLYPLRSPATDASGNVIYFESDKSGVITSVDTLSVDMTGHTRSSPIPLSKNLKLSFSAIFPSPDGTLLAIIGPWKAASILNTQSGGIEPFSSNFNIDQFYGWYPDNQRVLVRFESQGLWLVNPTGEEKTPLAVPCSGEVYGAAASPDGKRVVYTYQNETWMVNADGHNAYQLSQQIASAGLFSWSPDGSKIAFAGSGWMLMDADGSNPHTIGDHTFAQGYMLPPLWSPDSKTLAVVGSDVADSFSETSEEKIFNGTNIFLIDVNTGEERPLLNNQSTGNIDPAWSPDGSMIAFISNRSGSSEVWVINNDGSSLHQVTTDGQFKRFPYWYKP